MSPTALRMRKKLCSCWSTMSVWYPPPLPPDPSHHQVVFSWQLTTSLHPWVRYIWLKVWWDDHWHPALAILVPSGLPWGPWCQLGPHCDLERSLITERHSGLDRAGHSSQSCPSRSRCQVTKQDYGVPSQNIVWHRPKDSKKWLLLCPHKLTAVRTNSWPGGAEMQPFRTPMRTPTQNYGTLLNELGCQVDDLLTIKWANKPGSQPLGVKPQQEAPCWQPDPLTGLVGGSSDNFSSDWRSFWEEGAEKRIAF